MTHQQHRFQTNGSSALKVEDLEYDVFVKPSFLTDSSQATIIDFDEARQIHELSQVESDRSRPSVRSRNACLSAQKGLSQRIVSRIKTNKILGDIFTSKSKNTYRQSDLVIFAKGFTVTGFATFIMILFGV